MREVLFQVEDLSVGYDQDILKNINLSLYEGSCIPIIGGNGVGKTTLLKTLFGFLNKRSGSITVNSQKLESYSVKEISQIIAISLSDNLNTGLMSCSEFVSLGLLSLTEREKKLRDIFTYLEIEELFDQEFNKLSDGQKEWVKIARVFVQKTKVIFLDEPMGHLDIIGKVKMMYFLEKYAVENKACILITSHDWDVIKKVSTSIYTINRKGEMALSSPEDIIIEKKLKEIYPLSSESIYENDDGDFSLKIKQLFFFSILSDCDRKSRWLEHALVKIGFGRDEHDLRLPDVAIRGDHYFYEDHCFQSIKELSSHLKKQL